MIPQDLLEELDRINRARESGSAPDEAAIERRFAPSRRLAVYGTLAPGRSNHGLLRDVAGSWTGGEVTGDLHASGWGMTLGYPGLSWRPDGPRVAVAVLESDLLPGHWDRLDRFEGEEYVRILVPVMRESRPVTVANLYAVATPG